MADVEEPIEVAEEVEEEVVEEEVEDDVEYGGDEKEVKLFGKWSFNEIEVRDISLEVRGYDFKLIIHVIS